MSDALSDLRIIEIGEDISAPYAVKLLADLGADVIKIERPGTGDPLRHTGSFPGVAHDPTTGALFRYLNSNKRSIQLDLAARSGSEALLLLVSGADLVIENLGAGFLERTGLGFARLSDSNPRIALVRISDFGQDGPDSSVPATDFTVQAASGWVSKHMAPGREPVPVGGRISDYVSGAHAACAALMACRIAAQLNTAVSVDVSKQECLVSTLPQPALQLQTLQSLGWGIPEDRVFPVPGVVLCKDGYVGINVLTARHFEDFCHLVGIPEHIPNRMSLQVAGPKLDAFYRDIQPWLGVRGVEEIVELCQTYRIPAAPVSNGQTLPELAQMRARGFYRKGANGDSIVPGFPWRMEVTPPSLRYPAPKPGEHGSDSVRSAWGREGRWESCKASMPGVGNQLPFAGLRVLDLGIMWAGPYVGCYLGAFGADVIKVESIQRPDPYRFSGSYPEQGSDWYERSAIYQGTNLNKRGLTLNLNSDDGRGILERLITKADVLIENYSPRVLENMGLGVERLKALNPRLIVLRMPGFGLEGPWRDYVGWAMSFEQATGMAWVTGSPEDAPLNPGGFVDPTVTMHALVAVQAALLHRDRTRQAQVIEVAQCEVGACITAEQVIAYSASGKLLSRTGNRSDTMAPQGIYPCADKELVAISVRDDAEWEKLVEMMGSPELQAQRGQLRSLAQRQARSDDIDRIIVEWTRGMASDAVLKLVRGAGLPIARVLKAEKMNGDLHLSYRRFYEELPHQRTGVRPYAGWPMRFSVGPTRHHRLGPPTLGQHNFEILSEEAGLTPGEIEELARKDIIGTIPKGLG